MKELTEGMQRLCAVANRVVAKQEKVSRIDVDLLLENLRHLYEVALKMECGREEAEKCEKVEETKNQKDEESPSDFRLPTSDLHEGSSSDMAMMLTMAAMQPEGLGADESGKVEVSKSQKVEEEKSGKLKVES